MSKLLYTWKDFYLSPDKIHTYYYYASGKHTEADVKRHQIMMAKAKSLVFLRQ